MNNSKEPTNVLCPFLSGVLHFNKRNKITSDVLHSVNIFLDWIPIIINFEYNFGEDLRIQNFWAVVDHSQLTAKRLGKINYSSKILNPMVFSKVVFKVNNSGSRTLYVEVFRISQIRAFISMNQRTTASLYTETWPVNSFLFPEVNVIAGAIN